MAAGTTNGGAAAPAPGGYRPGRETARLIELEWAHCLRTIALSALTRDVFTVLPAIVLVACLGSFHAFRASSFKLELATSAACAFIVVCCHAIVLRETVRLLDHRAAVDRLRRAMAGVAELSETDVARVRLLSGLSGDGMSMHRRLEGGTGRAARALVAAIVAALAGVLSYTVARHFAGGGHARATVIATAIALVAWIAASVVSRRVILAASREIDEARRASWPEE